MIKQKRNYPQISAVPATGFYPLSSQQERILYLSQLAPESTVWNRISCTILTGDIDIQIIIRALKDLIQRHTALRTRISLVDNSPVQSFIPFHEAYIQYMKLSNPDKSQNHSQAINILQKEYEIPIKVIGGQLFKTVIIELNSAEYMLIFKLHHIISDATTLQIIWRELKQIYNAYFSGQNALIPLSVQYPDYVLWQRGIFDESYTTQQEVYWLNEFQGELPLLNLPVDFPVHSKTSFNGAMKKMILSKEISMKLAALSLNKRVALFSTLLTVYYVLLNKYSGQEDIIIGTVFSGRHYNQQLRNLVGFFVNTVAVRINQTDEQSFSELLKQIHQKIDEAYYMQDYPFNKLIQKLNPERDSANRNPLYRVLINMVTSYKENNGFRGVEQETRIKPELNSTQADLFLDIRNNPDDIELRFEYNTDIFRAETIEQLIHHYNNLLHNVINNPQVRISELEIIDSNEKKKLLIEWNNTYANYPMDKLIHELFEDQAHKNPSATALIFEDKQLTYEELNQKANQLAHYLHKLGVKNDIPVGICMERSLEMVIAIYGILKAGGAYTPLDATYPVERLANIILDTGTPVVLTQQHLLNAIPQTGAKILYLDSDWKEIERESTDNLKHKINPDELAYIIYTSGSTGKPKGVMNTHGGLLNRILWMQKAYQLTNADRVLQKTPYTFDVSVWEFTWPLITGATLVIARPEGHKDAAYLAEIIQKQRVTTIHFVPSMLNVLLETKALAKCFQLKMVFCSGEALTYDIQERFFNNFTSTGLYNLYGPTEAAIDVTYWNCRRNTSYRVVPIGKPIDNTTIYIVDKHFQPVPVGIPGELLIGGVGLARGYLNRPDLTEEKFIKNPIAGTSDKRLYRTGDLARFLPDGNIEFMGRIDHQVKIRGFRIELGEIESSLLTHPMVKEAVVRARNDINREKYLVAYLIIEPTHKLSADNLFTEELQKHLEKWLPNYMIPSFFIKLDKLPLNSNGKIDINLLPVPDFSQVTIEQYIPPTSDVEKKLVEITENILQIDGIGVNTNFFKAGGNSLLTIRFIAEIEEALGVTLNMKDFINLPVLSELAITIEDMRLAMEDDEEINAQINYWKEQLTDAPGLLNLPLDKPRPLVPSFQGEIETFKIDQDLMNKLIDMSQQAYAKLYMTMLAGFTITLAANSSQDEFMIGFPFLNNQSSSGGIPFNILPLRIQLKDKNSLREIISDIRQVVLDAYANQEISFERLLRELEITTDLNYYPLCQVIFIFTNQLGNIEELPDLNVTSFALKNNTALADIALLITETTQGLEGYWEYNSSLFDKDTIRKFNEHYLNTLKQIVENPEQKISELAITG